MQSAAAAQTEGWISPYLRRQRFEAAAPHLHDRVLDVGCGDGRLSNCVRAVLYVGVDSNPAVLQIARSLHPGVRFDSQPPPDSVFDTVACLATVEHMRELPTILRTIWKHLRPHGTLVITTPSPGFRWLHELGAGLGFCSAEAARDHHQFLGRDELDRLCRECGFRMTIYRTFLFGLNQLFVFERLAD